MNIIRSSTSKKSRQGPRGCSTFSRGGRSAAGYKAAAAGHAASVSASPLEQLENSVSTASTVPDPNFRAKRLHPEARRAVSAGAAPAPPLPKDPHVSSLKGKICLKISKH